MPLCSRRATGWIDPPTSRARWHLVAAREIAELAASGEFGGNAAQLEQRLDAARAQCC